MGRLQCRRAKTLPTELRLCCKAYEETSNAQHHGDDEQTLGNSARHLGQGAIFKVAAVPGNYATTTAPCSLASGRQRKRLQLSVIMQRV